LRLPNLKRLKSSLFETPFFHFAVGVTWLVLYWNDRIMFRVPVPTRTGWGVGSGAGGSGGGGMSD
jgi:hypothetical protein